jgi:RHS repeat-associated protein
VSENYSYDAANHRVKKESGGVVTHYIWDEGDQVIAEYERGGDATPATGIRYYHQDQLSTRFITNSDGAVVGTMDHLSFGEDAGGSGESEKHKFTTYVRDQTLDYAVNRYYSPQNGRFAQVDPMGKGCQGNNVDKPNPLGSADKNMPQTLNLYSYVTNDPVNRTDPTGLYSIAPFITDDDWGWGGGSWRWGGGGWGGGGFGGGGWGGDGGWGGFRGGLGGGASWGGGGWGGGREPIDYAPGFGPGGGWHGSGWGGGFWGSGGWGGWGGGGWGGGGWGGGGWGGGGWGDRFIGLSIGDFWSDLVCGFAQARLINGALSCERCFSRIRSPIGGWNPKDCNECIKFLRGAAGYVRDIIKLCFPPMPV